MSEQEEQLVQFPGLVRKKPLMELWMEQMLFEQKKQTAILSQMSEQQGLLIQALAEDQGDQDPDAVPAYYMDGTPCR